MTPQRVTEKKKIDTAKNVRAVKGMLKQIEWLGWTIVWEADGFVYKRGKERVAPRGLLVSETQRRINKLERFPLAAKQVLGDVSKWKEQMEGLLNRAKYFASLGVPDFESIKTSNKTNHKEQEKQFAQLLNLLEAEAICFNSLPASPCRLLAEMNRTNSSSARCAAIERHIQSVENSLISRALAALVLGAAPDTRAPELRKEESRELKAWINRCIQWGQGAGDPHVGKRRLSIDPVLLVLLLETDSGSTNTKKVAELTEELVYFHLPLAEFKLMLQSGTSSDTISELASQFQMFEQIGEKLLVYRSLIPESGDIKTRKKASKKLELERLSSLDKLRGALVKIIETQTATLPLSKLLIAINDLLERYSVSRKLVTELATVAQHAAALEPSVRNEFLDILHEHHDLIWVVETHAPPNENKAQTQETSVESEPPSVESEAEETAPVENEDSPNKVAADESISTDAVVKEDTPESAASEPAGSEPAASEPAGLEPAASEPAASMPAASELAAAEKTSSTTHREISSKSTHCGGTLQQIFDVLSNTKTPSLVRRGLEEGTLAYLCASKFKDPTKSERFLQWCRRIEFSQFHLFWSLVELMNALPQWAEIDPLIENFVKVIEQVPANVRGNYYQVIDDFSQKKKRELKSDLRTAAEFMPSLVETTRAVESCECACYVMMRIALQFGRKLPRLAPALQTWLADFYIRQKSVKHSQNVQLERGCDFGVIFVGALLESPVWQAGSETFHTINLTEKMEEIASTFIHHEIDTHPQAIADGILVLQENALLARLSLDKFKTQPHRCIKLFANMGATRKLSGTTKEPYKAIAGYRAKERALAALARNGFVKASGGASVRECGGGKECSELSRPPGLSQDCYASKDLEASHCVKLDMFDRHVVKRLCSKGWSGVVERSPHLVPEVASYVCSRSITKESQEPPQAVLKVLSMKENLVREKIHLESKLTRSDTASVNAQRVQARLKNLEQRLADGVSVEQQVKRLLEKQIHHLAAEAELCALEHVVDEVIRNHLKAIIGAQAKDIVIDSFLLNAILLTQDVDMNKRLLRKLIKAHIDGDREWRHRIPANKQFLEKLKEQGTEPDIWLGSHLRTFKLDGIRGGAFTVHLETDALKILEMGNYFDTCLSFGGINSFSTVTNAVDLNKRVVYAFDKHGTAIGRKLIGLNGEGKLIGYRTYTSIENQETDEALNKLLNDYIRKFAKMCNLSLASDGTVPSLATKFWYDDGVEPWSEDREGTAGGTENGGATKSESQKSKKRKATLEKRKGNSGGSNPIGRRKGCQLPGNPSSSRSLESHTQV